MFCHTLDSQARELFIGLGREPWIEAFYLAGGSAAALHLGHRVSVDLDFFSEQAYEVEPLVQRLRALGRLTIQQQSPGTMVGRLDGVRISFFTYPYPLLEKPIIVDGVRVASLSDIALMKIVAIGQRGRMRDFVDLVFICRAGWSLEELLRRIPQKYTTVSYPSYHLLRALTYFDDAEGDEPPKMLMDFDWAEVRRFFEGEVRRLMGTL